MAIPVVCPSCRARFQVSEKFAGKEGPCPKCKGKIQVPALDEQVVVHAPEEFGGGGKDSKGRPVLKPIARVETKAQPVMIAGVIVGALVTVAIALIAGRSGLDEGTKQILLAVGAIVLAPPLVLGAYSFLRNQELEAYTGKQLMLRVAICSAVYAGLWGVIWALKANFAADPQVREVWIYLILAGPPIIAGSLTALATLDLDFGSGFMHYACYLVVTVLLRLAMNLTPL